MKNDNIKHHAVGGNFDATETIPYCSLFASAGLGEWYLRDLGFVNKVANELNRDRCRWYKEVYPHCDVVQGDFTNINIFDEVVRLYKLHGCRGVIASPSCQTFSTAGSRDFTDRRTFLFQHTLDFIKATNPEWVVIENVPQFLTAKLDGYNGMTIGEFIKQALERMGYFVNVGVLNFADYGVAQARRRGIITARKARMWEFPTPDIKQLTLRDVIGDLPSIECGQKSGILYHDAPVWTQPQIDCMKTTPTGERAKFPVNVDGSPSKAKFKCAFQRKEWDVPCNTILQDSASISGFRNAHPGRLLPDGTYSDCRPLTILELARVSSIPDDYPYPEFAITRPRFVRQMFGECVCPEFYRRLFMML